VKIRISTFVSCFTSNYLRFVNEQERLIILIVENIESIPFEARKDSALIFNNLMRKNIANFASYMLENFDIVKRLIEGYEQPDAALNCGSMIRECIRHNSLASAILSSEYLWKFFDSYVHFPNFEVASDAFNSLRDLLVTVKNKSISSAFLDAHFTEVFMHYEILLKKGNYVTRRRALKLLGELLLDRSNFNIMIRFIASREHLKVMLPPSCSTLPCPNTDIPSNHFMATSGLIILRGFA
jgi:calcium binding protein 39